MNRVVGIAKTLHLLHYHCDDYREGQEQKLGALALMLNIVVYWDTLYLGGWSLALRA